MKLYWRYKKNGKWTWKAANVCEYMYDDDGNVAYAHVKMEEEE